jgi:uncharacterized protein YndB with AHSA1/START domain
MTTETTTDREIVMSRVFDAPRTLVWQAWTEADRVAQWWGPNGFSNTISEMNLRPGGVWRFIMHGPDGTNYPNKIVYEEIVEPERLVYMHGSDGGNDISDFHVTVTFDEQGKGTRVTMRSLFPSKDSRDYVVREYGALEGAQQHLGRLAEYLAKQ